MTNITFKYNITGNGLLKTIIFNMYIPEFLEFLNNNTDHEIHTRGLNNSDDATADSSDVMILIKINFKRDNNIIDIYYQSLDSGVLNSKLVLKDMNAKIKYVTIVKKAYHTLEACKWMYLATLYKPAFTNRTPMYSLWYGEFILKFRFKLLPSDYIKMHQFNSPKTLSNDFQYLLNNERFSDVTMKSAEQIEYKVHKVVLDSRSAVLKAHFEHNTTECLTNVVESPFESEVLKEVLTFIYTDKAPRVNEIPEKLLPAADYYQLSPLKSLCEEALHKKLAIDNAIETLQLADLHSAVTLKQLTLEFIDNEKRSITKTESWANINCVKLMKMIFEYKIAEDLEKDEFKIKYYDLFKDENL